MGSPVEDRSVALTLNVHSAVDVSVIPAEIIVVVGGVRLQQFVDLAAIFLYLNISRNTRHWRLRGAHLTEILYHVTLSKLLGTD